MRSLVFIGNEQISSTRTPTKMPILRQLINDGYVIEKIILKGKPQKSRKPRPSPAADLAHEHNIPLSLVASKQELLQEVSDTNSPVAVLVAFGMMVPASVIDHFQQGIVNVHPSLLPSYRGSTPIETAILNGDDQTGVSIMALSSGMDEGDIYGFALHHIEPQVSKAELTAQLGDLSASLLGQLLPDIFTGSLQPMPQDHTQATYTNMLSRDDATLDASKSADYLERKVRAHLDWPGSKTQINDIEVSVLEARSVPSIDKDLCGQLRVVDGNELVYYSSDGCLRLDKVQPGGGKEMSAKDFINGYL